MRRIIQANIDRFTELLRTETDPTKRAMEMRLLAEEEAKLKNYRRMTIMKPKLIDLSVVGPFAPMGRLYVDGLFR
jgi:hypothetical protein